MMGPNEYEKFKLDGFDPKVFDEIDEELKQSAIRGDDFPEAMLKFEIYKGYRKKIAQRYLEEGWYRVAHITSSENGERGGLTHFYFLTEENFEHWNNVWNRGMKWNIESLDER